MPKSKTPKQIIKLLEQYGFFLKRTKGSHFIYQHPGTTQRIIVPMHARDLPKGTLHTILRQAGILKEEL